jgi:lipopolysaccharide transport system ATP-binding protein
MSEPAIRVDGLGKRYRLGRRERYLSLRDSLSRAASRPLRWLRESAATDENTPDSFWALKDVSFEVEHGEVVGIIGRNGAGKSTLLKILSRITEPTAGRVELYGRVGSLLEVGTGFHPELTGRENIFLNGAVLGMVREEIARKFDEIVAFSGVEKFLDTAVKHYSSGMYMRLAFAVAAHLEPEILVVDEVLAVGDAEFQAKCLGKISEVAAHGRTVLFVSHNMGAIERLCRKVMLLDGGRVVRYTTEVSDTIVEYLFGRARDNARTEWTNPGKAFDNPWFRPARFWLADPNGRPAGSPIRNDADLWLEIEADVAVLDPALTVGYALFNEEGFLLYWSYQTDGPAADWPRLRDGRNLLRSRLPRRLLNEGTYRLELTGGLHCRQWLFEPGVSAPAIYFTIQGGLSDSPLWVHRRPGLLAPVISWEVR